MIRAPCFLYCYFDLLLFVFVIVNDFEVSVYDIVVTGRCALRTGACCAGSSAHAAHAAHVRSRGALRAGSWRWCGTSL